MFQNLATRLSEPFQVGPPLEVDHDAHAEPSLTVPERLLTGAIGGAIATGAMTAVMATLYRTLPRNERYPLQPSQMVMSLARMMGISEEKTSAPHVATTLALHFGYGAAAGVGYTFTTSASPIPGPVKGLSFGLGLWALGYFGWAPSLRVLRPMTEFPLRRALLLLTSHLVWGATMGVFDQQVARIIRRQ